MARKRPRTWPALAGAAPLAAVLLLATPSLAPAARVRPITVVLAGDLALTGTLGLHGMDPALERSIRSADLAVANLETTFHRWSLAPAAEGGGTYLCADPDVASELAEAGFDLLSLANNHALDFGPPGLTATIEALSAAGVKTAGGGRGLAEAGAPARYRAAGVPISFFAVTTTFPRGAEAPPQAPGIPPRCGIAPWRLDQVITLPRARWLQLAAILRDLTPPIRPTEDVLRWGGATFVPGDRQGRAWRLDPGVLGGLADSVRREAGAGRLVMVSIHCHQWDDTPFAPPRSIRQAAEELVHAGARVVFLHGIHLARGVRLVAGGVILEGLGTFVDQTAQVDRQPPEAFARFGMDREAPLEELVRRTRHLAGADLPIAHEALLAEVQLQDGRLLRIVLHPVITAGRRGAPGTPQIPSSAQARSVLERLRKLSALGTATWTTRDGRAVIELPAAGSSTIEGDGPQTHPHRARP